MDSQDKVLVGALKRLGYPIQEAATIDSLQFTELVSICSFFLRMSGEQVEEIKIGSNMSQRFKIVGPIIERMKKRGIAIDMTLLLNPNPNDVRNMLLNLLGKSE